MSYSKKKQESTPAGMIRFLTGTNNLIFTFFISCIIFDVCLFLNNLLMIKQTTISLPAFPRGFHLITREVINQLPVLPQTGVLHLFIKHTSAGLTINENADPSVRTDFESIFNKLVPENMSFLQHTLEGPDDMPAHIKTALTDTCLTIPITEGQLNLGTWQGIYLCEFRNRGGNRSLVATVVGDD